MPRIDNSQANIDAVNILIEEMWGSAPLLEDFHEEGPGLTPPIDLCRWCFELMDGYGPGDEIEHPSYDLDFYQCAVCGDELEEGDG